jgi:hypothetical protein
MTKPTITGRVTEPRPRSGDLGLIAADQGADRQFPRNGTHLVDGVVAQSHYSLFYTRGMIRLGRFVALDGYLKLTLEDRRTVC